LGAAAGAEPDDSAKIASISNLAMSSYSSTMMPMRPPTGLTLPSSLKILAIYPSS